MSHGPRSGTVARKIANRALKTLLYPRFQGVRLKTMTGGHLVICWPELSADQRHRQLRFSPKERKRPNERLGQIE